MAPRVSPIAPTACRGSVGFVAHGDEDQGAALQGLHEACESLVGNLHMWGMQWLHIHIRKYHIVIYVTIIFW